MRRVACFAICLALGCATPIEQQPWRRITTPHFELVGDAHPERMFEIAGRLELLRAVLARVGIDASLEPRVPFLVYVFGDSASFARFQKISGITGFAVPGSDRIFLAIDGESDSIDAETTALHEYVHFVLANGEATEYPLWYREGLAELFSTVSIEEGRVVIARVPPARAQWLRLGSPLRLRRVMAAEDLSAWSPRYIARFYAQSWALAHYFFVADRAGYPKRRAQLAHYIRLRNRGVDPDAACQQAFGQGFEGLEREFLRYLGEGSFPYLGLPREALDLPERRSSGTLPEGEKRLLLGELALALGDDWRGEARHWFELAVDADPQDARAHAALGLALAAREERGAAAHLERAVALGEADPEVQRRVGEALLERAGKAGRGEASEIVERARRHFRRSLELDPRQVSAHAGLGRSYLAAPYSGDPAEGLEALRTAHARLPGDPEIALALAQLELLAGATERARTLLAHLPTPSRADPRADTERSEIERTRDEAGLPAPHPVDIQQLETRLEVATPHDGARVRGGSGWTLVEGRGGLSEAELYDVLVAIDESRSTLSPTGTDLDGDGTVGERQRFDESDPDSASSDPGDTVIRAELEAARVLIRQLSETSTRVGLFTFGGEATLRAPLGAPAAATGALEEYEIRVDPSEVTSIAKALAYSMQEFFEQREVGTRRQRAILLLSDGQPTVPSKLQGQRDALELADQLGELGIPVYAFALGKQALEEPDFYRNLAERSGGRFVPVERPAEVVSHVAELRLTGLEAVAIRNESNGEAARALRLFPDGSFDAYVPLVPGDNRIAITASVEGDRSLEAERTVHFERPARPTAEDRRAAEELRQEIETRGVELELLAEIRRRREQATPTTRELDVEVER